MAMLMVFYHWIGNLDTLDATRILNADVRYQYNGLRELTAV